MLFRSEKMGHSVKVVATGKEALTALAGNEFDLTFMDVQMPEMDGFEATGLIRKQEIISGMHATIVAMTAHAMVGDRERCLEAGMDHYISKPIREPALIEVLEKVEQSLVG